jgi:hypothetical protein
MDHSGSVGTLRFQAQPIHFFMPKMNPGEYGPNHRSVVWEPFDQDAIVTIRITIEGVTRFESYHMRNALQLTRSCARAKHPLDVLSRFKAVAIEFGQPRRNPLRLRAVPVRPCGWRTWLWLLWRMDRREKERLDKRTRH